MFHIQERVYLQDWTTEKEETFQTVRHPTQKFLFADTTGGPLTIS